MADLTITKVNDTWMKVTCAETWQELDINDKFRFQVPGAQYDPRVRSGKWDGFKKLYNRKTRRMYTGLLFQLLSFCDEKGWSTHIDPDLIPDGDALEDEDLDQLIELFQPHSDGKPIEPFDYQREAVKYMISMDRSTCLAATSAGKSLMLYLAVRTYQLLDEMSDKKIFIVVPSISLVEQMYNDFKDYSTFDGSKWNVASHVQKISGKYSKQVDKQIVVTTWQSMDKLPHYIYEDMGAIFVDETHTASAKILTSILERCTTTPHRHGLTGTLDGSECNQMVIEGLLGPIKRIVTAREIIDQGRASEVEVRMTMIKYPQSIRQELAVEKANVPSKQRYHKEVDFVTALEPRRQFLYSLIQAMPGNSLVLFDRVEGYGRELYETYKELHENTFLIVGDVDTDRREEIRQIMEQFDDAVIFASYGTMQQGVSIKKLHNLFLISSSKSVIRILQSIGRMMRLHGSKSHARIFDVVDDLTFDGRENYMLTHAQERINMYVSEQYKVEFDQYDINKYINTEEDIEKFF